jgi:hypothetical protein
LSPVPEFDELDEADSFDVESMAKVFRGFGLSSKTASACSRKAMILDIASVIKLKACLKKRPTLLTTELGLTAEDSECVLHHLGTPTQEIIFHNLAPVALSPTTDTTVFGFAPIQEEDTEDTNDNEMNMKLSATNNEAEITTSNLEEDSVLKSIPDV